MLGSHCHTGSSVPRRGQAVNPSGRTGLTADTRTGSMRTDMANPRLPPPPKTTRRKDCTVTVDAAPEGQAVDPYAVAQRELSENTVPTPDDVLQDVGPLTALWYARETAYYAMQLLSATLSADLADTVPDDSEPVRALAALSTACGELDGACALVALLPPDYGDHAPA